MQSGLKWFRCHSLDLVERSTSVRNSWHNHAKGALFYTSVDSWWFLRYQRVPLMHVFLFSSAISSAFVLIHCVSWNVNNDIVTHDFSWLSKPRKSNVSFFCKAISGGFVVIHSILWSVNNEIETHHLSWLSKLAYTGRNISVGFVYEYCMILSLTCYFIRMYVYFMKLRKEEALPNLFVTSVMDLSAQFLDNNGAKTITIDQRWSDPVSFDQMPLSCRRFFSCRTTSVREISINKFQSIFDMILSRTNDFSSKRTSFHEFRARDFLWDFVKNSRFFVSFEAHGFFPS